MVSGRGEKAVRITEVVRNELRLDTALTAADVLVSVLAGTEKRLRGYLPLLVAEVGPKGTVEVLRRTRRSDSERRLSEALAALAYLLDQVPVDPQFRNEDTLAWVREMAVRWGGPVGVRTVAEQEGQPLPQIVTYPRDYLKTLSNACRLQLV